MNCKCVLLIEDELPVREMMRDVLELEGYQVLSAANGKDALEALHASPTSPCVILLDLMMPVMNGWEFLDVLRSSPRHSHVPVVICSAFHETAKSIRPSAILKKPFQLPSLLKTVQAFCAA